MKTLEKLQHSIRSRDGAVVLRRDLSHLGGASQLTAALAMLVDRGDLVRVSPGVYAKTKAGAAGRRELAAEPANVVAEALKKLGKVKGVNVVPRSDKEVQVIVNPSGSRIFRQWSLGGTQVGLRRAEPSSSEKLRDLAKQSLVLPKVLPTTNVAAFVADLANKAGVKAARTKLDEFAEAVTRMAGDDVRLDDVEQTLVALKERNVVNGRQMGTLMLNHMREMRSVRPVR
ncbi:MAG: hypothetical protein K5880_22115 [Hydrogenophaga sp.]|uniref:hypothetical protein n=1 Tax=Hydrogenophaga sp. TaxID=1904254 RepID=UPI002621188F|nr:hypothetical protein [Hydrogenophaga sp.]MCV0441299.1 hypothetical protein [Hydrogenophaga sp.]